MTTPLPADDLALWPARWAGLDGAALIAAARAALPGRLAAIASFGTESAVLLDLIAQVDPALPVIVIDTGELFDETHAYIASLTAHLGLTGVRIVRPDPAEIAAAADLWQSDPDRCCGLRKVAPLARASRGYAALIDGRRRAHGFGREAVAPAVLRDGVLRLSPVANLDDAGLAAAFAARALPRHPLEAAGYRSIGCWPCTRPVGPDEPARAGRWAGAAKTECGIHLPSSPPAAPPARTEAHPDHE